MKIALYDTGIGGLAALRECLLAAPGARWIFIADEAFFPAGHRQPAELRTRLGVVSSVLRAAGVDVFLPVGSAFWPHLDAVELPGCVIVDPVQAVAQALAPVGGITGLLAPVTLLSSDVPRRVFNGASYVAASSTRIGGLVECCENPDATLAGVTSEAVRTLSDARVDQLAILDSHAQRVTGLVRRACRGVQAIDVPRALADALSGVVGEAALSSGTPEIEIWVPDEYRARLALAARETLQLGSLRFLRFNPEARMQVLGSAPDLALLAYAAIGRRSRGELQNLVTVGATHAGGGDLVDVLLPQHPSQAWRYEIDSVFAAGALVGVSGVKRADDGTEQAFAHQVTVRNGRIEHLVEVI